MGHDLTFNIFCEMDSIMSEQQFLQLFEANANRMKELASLTRDRGWFWLNWFQPKPRKHRRLKRWSNLRSIDAEA